MKSKLTIDFISYDSALTNNPEDAIKIKKSVSESNITEVFRRQESIANAVSNQVIPLPDVASDYLLIFTDQTITIKLNGSSDAITLSPKAAGTKTPTFVVRGIISGLTVSNASGNAANVDIIAVNI